jgi:hypothetical protein
MGLFDVIRYPVDDIFSDEINSFPREIMVPWLKDCYQIVGLTDVTTNIDKCEGFSTFVHMLILRADLDLTDNGKVEIGDRLKEYFTILLRERIRDYDGV